MPSPDKLLSFEANSRTYQLYFGNRALREYEQAAGTNAIRDFTNGEVSVTNITILLLAGLKQMQPDITIEDVDDILDDIGMVGLLAKLTKAVGLALPKNALTPVNQ